MPLWVDLIGKYNFVHSTASYGMVATSVLRVTGVICFDQSGPRADNPDLANSPSKTCSV